MFFNIYLTTSFEPSCTQHLCHPVNPGWSVGGRSLPGRWAVSVPRCPAACWLNHLQISGCSGLRAATAPAGRPSPDTHGGQFDESWALPQGPGTQTQHTRLNSQVLSVDSTWTGWMLTKPKDSASLPLSALLLPPVAAETTSWCWQRSSNSVSFCHISSEASGCRGGAELTHTPYFLIQLSAAAKTFLIDSVRNYPGCFTALQGRSVWHLWPSPALRSASNVPEHRDLLNYMCFNSVRI